MKIFMNSSLLASVETAVDNINQFGDTDIFPKFSGAGFAKLQPSLLRECVHQLHENFVDLAALYPPTISRMVVPVGRQGFRLGTQIDPIWNAGFLSLIIAARGEIEQQRAPISRRHVFSYRLLAEPEGPQIFDAQVNWAAFCDTSLDYCKEFPWVITGDLADFYHRIRPHRLLTNLYDAGVDKQIADRIGSMLKLFEADVYGLPVGGPAARVLAELYLVGTDRLIEDCSGAYCRFVDDFRIFACSQQEAVKISQTLLQHLSDLGLSLQKSKTRIMRSADLSAEISLLRSGDLPPPKAGSGVEAVTPLEAGMFDLDPYSEMRAQDNARLSDLAAAPDIISIFQNEFLKDRLNIRVSRQLLRAIPYMTDEDCAVALETVFTKTSPLTLNQIFHRLAMVLLDDRDSFGENSRCVIRKEIGRLLLNDSAVLYLDLNFLYLLTLVHVFLPDGGDNFSEKLVERFRSTKDSNVRARMLSYWEVSGQHDRITELASKPWTLSPVERRSLAVAAAQDPARKKFATSWLDASDPSDRWIASWASMET